MSAATAPAPSAPSTNLNRALWAVQGLLAVAFTGAGLTKLTTPIAELAPKMGWVLDMPEIAVRLIGASEVAGAVGLLAPSLLRIAPKLTPLAAALLAVVMVLGAGVHLQRGEAGILPVNLVLGGLSLFVAWGRAKAVPIAAK